MKKDAVGSAARLAAQESRHDLEALRDEPAFPSKAERWIGPLVISAAVAAVVVTAAALLSMR